jgi:hypothetical protein
MGPSIGDEMSGARGKERTMTPRRWLVSILSIAFCSLLLTPGLTTAQDASPVPPDGECAVTTVEENVALVRRLMEAVHTADGATIDEILADDYTHNTNRYGLPDDPTTNDDEILLGQMMQQYYANSTQEITEIFGVDNKVVVESVQTITQHTITGELVVLDEPIIFRTIGIFTIECGEVVSLNALADELSLLVGLGAVTLPEMTPVDATPTS